ncbi:MAG: metallophosphoesterase [bacterium]|nr:metallophosphoesterase [bacterium]
MSSKRILLISDTHGFHENLQIVLEKEEPFDLVLHMGDYEGWDAVIDMITGVPVEYVSGNCDWSSRLPSEKMIEINGVHIFMTHGHEYYVTTGMDVLRDHAVACGCQVVLFGHTHWPFFEEQEGVIIANPGSISRPRQTNRRPSYGVMEISDEGEIKLELKQI